MGTVAVAIVGLAAAIVAVVAMSMHSGPSRSVVAHRTVALHGPNASAKAIIVEARDGTDVMFRGKLGANDSDPYWLWLTDATGHRLAAATFRDGRDGSFSIRGHGAIAYRDVQRVWVTDAQNHVVLDTAWKSPTSS